MAMKVFIDPDLCQGHARCFQLAPNVFRLDEQGHGQPLQAEVDPNYEPAARTAVANCPERAIRIEED
jgi:ferredoxin